jgi:hypothetical protein
MSRQTTLHGLPALTRRNRAARARRQALARELTAYSSDAERNDLEIMVDASPTSAAWEIGEILGDQAYGRLFQAR